MQAEIISIGTELTSGEKLDTNSQWLSIELSQIGIPVRFHTTMADDKAAMLEALRIATGRADIVLVTGGLGPTLDDLTRELLAELSGTDLVLDEPSLTYIRELFAKRAREFPERNRIQAMFPRGSEPIFNPIGTAPGIWMELTRSGRTPCLIAAMPGVPSEMKKMFREQVSQKLPRGSQVIRRVCVHTFGKGESAVEELLGELTARNRNPEVGITASSATITLRIAASATTMQECERLVELDRRFISERLGSLVFGEDDETLEGATIRLLNQSNSTVAVLEGGTLGLLSQILAGASGSTAALKAAEVIPSMSALQSRIGCCSNDSNASLATPEGAKRMAQWIREQHQSDFGLTVTPWSVPQTDSEVAMCFIALASKDGVEVQEHRILSDLSIAKPRASKTAINMLRLKLL